MYCHVILSKEIQNMKPKPGSTRKNPKPGSTRKNPKPGSTRKNPKPGSTRKEDAENMYKMK
jgi:hypothetical protein